MNRFDVDWTADVNDALTEIWLAASDRNAVSEAAHKIDVALHQLDPKDAVHVHEGLYRYRERPLEVLYAIEEKDCRIRVAFIRRSVL